MADRSTTLRQPMTVAAFLEREEHRPTRHEFDRCYPRAMIGGSAEYPRVQRNLIAALTSQPNGKRCELFGSELKILVAGSVRQPDAFAVCSSVGDKALFVSDPSLVFRGSLARAG